MVDIIVSCAHTFFGDAILKNKVSSDQNVTQGYGWLFQHYTYLRDNVGLEMFHKMHKWNYFTFLAMHSQPLIAQKVMTNH